MPVLTCKKCGRITAGKIGIELPAICENCGYILQTEQAEASNLNAGLATQHGLNGVFRSIISHRTMCCDLDLDKDEFDELIDDLVKAAMMGC